MKIISSSLDKDLFRQKLLDSFLKIFHMENSIFFLADGNSKLTDFMGINTEDRYLRDFINYYHRYDPFDLIQRPFRGNRIIRLENLIYYPSFLKTEYYNDFLRPQKIHYKTVVYLKSQSALQGIIGLFRPKGFGNFSEKDLGIIRILTPYLSQALKNIDIFRRIQFENSIFKMADQDSSSGLIILNDRLELVHMNNRAKDFCKILTNPDNGHQESGNSASHYPLIPDTIKEDCCHLKEQLKRGVSAITPLPTYRMLRFSEYRKYSLCSQILPKVISPENRLFYLIKIDDLTQQTNLNIGALEIDFGLTRRETEILVNIFNGLKNAEIAEKLFISEITVKKHLQHVFEKTGVNSRTALIRKTIEYQPAKGQIQDF